MATNARKATDLERLTQPGGQVMPDDATIPVLTERLTLPSLDLDISLPRPPPPVVAPPIAPFASFAPDAPPPLTVAPAPTPVAPMPPVFAPSLPVPAAPVVAVAVEIDWDKVEVQLRENLFLELHPQLTA
ncbi:MAG: hypothetical protein M3Q28_12825, partial [Pseudomonadota bacterium]|nr:hypothetical protein [Pseudomonadota bacterium]